MLYSEMAYFDGDHCQHCAAWQDHKTAMRRVDAVRAAMRETVRAPR